MQIKIWQQVHYNAVALTADDKEVHLNSLIRVPVGKLISAEDIWSVQSCDVIKVKKEASYQAWKLLPFKRICESDRGWNGVDTGYSQHRRAALLFYFIFFK